MKNLVVCGVCEGTNGTNVKKWIGSGFNVELKRPGGIVLGQITQNGEFLIKRGGQNYTRIIGSGFSVLCGNCGNEVYRKEAYDGNKEAYDGNSGDFWNIRLHREQISGTFQYGTG